MRMSACRAALVAASAILFLSRAAAHDLWLVPPASAKPSEKAVVSAVSGRPPRP